MGAGDRFAAHRRLIDYPDPRRIDVRASLRQARGAEEPVWLLRVAQQRVAVPVQVIVDVSASMHVGRGASGIASKLDAVADFVAALGVSVGAFGDAIAMHAFDGVLAAPRDDLELMLTHRRGAGTAAAQGLRATPAPQALRTATPMRAAAQGLWACAERARGIARRASGGLVFVVSDFHGLDIETLDATLDLLVPLQVVPMIVWHPDERVAPSGSGLLPVADAESNSQRSLWMRASLRQRWQEAIDTRREQLRRCFLARGHAPFELLDARGHFDADALTRYFLEGGV
jgi:hypothetical protein